MKLLDAAIKLAAEAHAGQRRKYTNHPYITHCIDVVNILIDHGVEDEAVLAAAALHDVLEDTHWTDTRLRIDLEATIRSTELLSKTARETEHRENYATTKRVVSLVKQLTEPALEGNRATRKAAEAVRLSKVSADAQTIKYADLISNTSSIVTHDTGFAKTYLVEKIAALEAMERGDALLRAKAQDIARLRQIMLSTIG